LPRMRFGVRVICFDKNVSTLVSQFSTQIMKLFSSPIRSRFAFHDSKSPSCQYIRD
jgi:hypothetical protein